MSDDLDNPPPEQPGEPPDTQLAKLQGIAAREVIARRRAEQEVEALHERLELARLNGGVEHLAEQPLVLQDLGDFVTKPNMRWLVRGILPPDSLVVVFGPPKGGKTFSIWALILPSAAAAKHLARSGGW